MLRIAVSFIIILFVVVCGSVVSGHFWASEKEQLPENIKVSINESMSVAEFGKQHNLGRKALKKVFGLSSPNELTRQVSEFGMNREQLSRRVNRVLAIQAEHASKNWFKIPLKGGLWVVFLSAVFVLLKKGKVSARNRKWIYVAAVAVFGIFPAEPASRLVPLMRYHLSMENGKNLRREISKNKLFTMFKQLTN